MSKTPDSSDPELFSMPQSSESGKGEKTKSSSNGGNGSNMDSLRDFMRATSGRPSEKASSSTSSSEDSNTSASYQPSIYKKPSSSESSETHKTMPTENPVIDYRKNVQRQVREQKKVSSALGLITYGVLGVVLLFGALAGYGAYVIFGELRTQKATAEQIRRDLNGQIETLQANLSQTQSALEQQSQQANETIMNLQKQLETQKTGWQADLANEKKIRNGALQKRDDEIYELRQRVRRLENRY
ncbi:MAG: hypothetical protein K1X66_00845 [Verrucomicrobiae bacterium]|nr:hypothetical protein [Verrucomicrobiae bacterium]